MNMEQAVIAVNAVEAGDQMESSQNLKAEQPAIDHGDNVHIHPPETLTSDQVVGFPLFPKLWTEIRLHIWGYIAMLPRIIELLDTGLQTGSYIADNAIPPARHACTESRQEFLNKYQRFYEVLEVKENVHDDESGVLFQTYINYDTDTLYFVKKHVIDRDMEKDYDWFFGRLSDNIDASSKLKFIALDGSRPSPAQPASRRIPAMIPTGLIELQGLQTITLTYGDKCCRDCQHKRLLDFEMGAATTEDRRFFRLDKKKARAYYKRTYIVEMDGPTNPLERLDLRAARALERAKASSLSIHLIAILPS